MPKIECGFTNPNQLVNFGPTIQVRIAFDFDKEQPDTTYHALIDTGATVSCINSTIADTLELPIINRIPISGVHGQQTVNLHLAQIEVPQIGVIVGPFAGVHLHAGGQPHSALIGRTFLQHVEMKYNGQTGSVVLEQPNDA